MPVLLGYECFKVLSDLYVCIKSMICMYSGMLPGVEWKIQDC